MNGLIEKYNRHFGFIRPLCGDGPNAARVWFHRSAVCMKDNIEPALPKGCEVSFDLVRGAKPGTVQGANIHIVPVNGRVLRTLNEKGESTCQ